MPRCNAGLDRVLALIQDKPSPEQMSDSLINGLGAVAACLASLSYIPQVIDAWPRHSTKNLSLKMLIALTCGLSLWIVYGALKGDWVIVTANTAGALLSGTVLVFKLRDMRS